MKLLSSSLLLERLSSVNPESAEPTQYAVECPIHGKVYLTPEEYDRQLSIHDRWRCPRMLRVPMAFQHLPDYEPLICEEESNWVGEAWNYKDDSGATTGTPSWDGKYDDADDSEELESYRKAYKPCEKHEPKGGSRGKCVICVLEDFSHVISQIDYLLGKPNEYQVSDYDWHRDEKVVLERLRQKLKKFDMAIARLT